MKATTLFSLALAAALCAPSAMADGRKPGSKLVYPVHRSGAGLFTIVCVTNTNTAPATPVSFGGGTNVHFEYANVVPNPADPCRPLDCIVFDRVEYLTPADTLCVLTSCHNATAGQGQEGYLVITAQDPYVFNTDWCHDYLIGSEMVVNGAGAVYGINAAALRCLEAPTAPCVLLEPCNGVHYECLPHSLMDSFIALAGSQLALVSATDDDPKIIRDLYFEVWNDNEFALSATKRMNCWFDLPLTSISPLFAESFLASTVNDPAELDINCDGTGDIETGWFRITTRALTVEGGQQVWPIADGILGAITAGPVTSINGARLLWETGLDADDFQN